MAEATTDVICPIIEEEEGEEKEVIETAGDVDLVPEARESLDVLGSESGVLHVQVTKDRVARRIELAKEELDGSDTDLEIEEEKADYDMSGRATYMSACRQLGVVPVSYFLRHMTDENLSMAHHGLASAGVRALCYPLMNNTHVLSLDLQDNWLEEEGGAYVAEMLKDNCYIAELNLSDNKLGANGCAALCNVLQTNVTLQSIDLSGNGLSDNDSESIASALYTNPRLRVVNLAMNGLGNEGAFGVAEILQHSGTMTSLDVSQNRIGTPGAITIGKALEANDILKTLKIGYNPVGLEGIKALLTGVCGSGSIVTDLDISSIEIDKEFRTMVEVLKESRDINVTHGQVLSDYVIVGKPKRKVSRLFSTPVNEITSENIMAVIRTFSDVSGLGLYDAMLSYDKSKEKCLTINDFLNALSDVGVEMTMGQIEKLDALLTEYRTPDGRIDFSSLR